MDNAKLCPFCFSLSADLDDTVREIDRLRAELDRVTTDLIAMQRQQRYDQLSAEVRALHGETEESHQYIRTVAKLTAERDEERVCGDLLAMALRRIATIECHTEGPIIPVSVLELRQIARAAFDIAIAGWKRRTEADSWQSTTKERGE